MKPRKEASPRCESWEGQAKLESPCLLVSMADFGRTPIPAILCGRANKCELTWSLLAYHMPRMTLALCPFAQFLLVAMSLVTRTSGSQGAWYLAPWTSHCETQVSGFLIHFMDMLVCVSQAFLILNVIPRGSQKNF